MAYTFDALVARAQAYLQDSTGARWPAALVGAFVNDGQRDFARGSKILKFKYPTLPGSTVNLLPQGAFYTLPSDFFELEGVWCDGRHLAPTTVDCLPWNWDVTTGTATRYIYGDYGPTDIRLYPAPTGGPGWLPSTVYVPGQQAVSNGNVYRCTVGGTSGATPPSGTTTFVDGGVTWAYLAVAPVISIYYARLPADIASSSTSPIPPQYHLALAYYATAQCCLLDGQYKDPARGAQFLQLYQHELTDAASRAARRQSADAVTVPYHHV